MRLPPDALSLSPGPAAIAFPATRWGASAAALVMGVSMTFGAAMAAPPVPTPRPKAGMDAPAARPAAPRDRLPTANVPFPEPRPMDLGEEEEEERPAEAEAAPAHPAAPARTVAPTAPASAPAASSAEATAVPPGELPALCAALVAQKTILAERAPPVDTKSGCSLPVPVRLTAVRLADGNLATLSPAAVMRCEAAIAIATWMREDIGPAIAALGTRLETIKVADSYSCRPRNRVRGAKISEHGMGNAFDTYGFVLADARVIEVKNGTMPMDFQAAMKASACARFSTVLGPGSDGYHEDHIHVDLAVRRLDIRLCKWNIKVPAPAQVARAEPQGEKKAEARPASPAATAAELEAAEAEPDEEVVADVPLPPRRPASLPRSRTAPPKT